MKIKILSLIGLAMITSLVVLPANSEASILDKCKLGDFKTYSYDDLNTDLKFRIAFETSRNQYHNYMNCIFDSAANDLFELVGEVDKINLPQSACLSDSKADQLKKVLTSNSANTLSAPVLQNYQNYANHLNTLVNKWTESIVIEDDLVRAADRRDALKRIVENEVQHALVSLDAAFVSLHHMRQAFVVHQHLQCTMKNLEVYRQILGNLRYIISTLSPLFHNASTTP